MITKPMLASKWEGEPLTFPVYATPKLDGIRALVIDKHLVSRTFKPIKNKNIVECLDSLPSGIDGELVSGNFQETTHRVMKEEETEGDWTYCVFDYVDKDLTVPYLDRMVNLSNCLTNISLKSCAHVTLLLPTRIDSFQELSDYEEKCLFDGFEGVIIRSGNSPYKCGRSSVKEGYMLKIKRFSDAEAKIVGFVEFEHNENEAQKDAFGRTKRSDKKEGKVLGNMLGKFILELPDGQQFGCGTGFTMEQRKDFWTNKEQYIGKLVKFKYFKVGQKDLPRHPVFLGFRDLEDL